MKTQAAEPRYHEFYFANLDTLVEVEQVAGAVTIRATRDTFSARRRECFIHELAAEGFIDDDYRWFSFTDAHPFRRVCWFVDYSWLKISPELTASTRRFVLRLFGAAVLLWLALMTALFLRTPG